MSTTESLDNITGEKPKIHVGFYMFTPMIGGAERLLRDLLFGIDREQFKVSLFYESWSEFDAFLNLDRHPDIQAIPLPIIEVGGHTYTYPSSHTIKKSKKITLHALIVSFLLATRSVYKKYFTFSKLAIKIVNVLLSCLFFIPNLISLYITLKKHKPDILHIINGGYPAAISAREASLAAKLTSMTCIMTVCASPVKQTFPRFMERKMDSLVYKCVDRFIVPAEPVGQLLTELRGFESSKICNITWGIPHPKSFLTDSAILDMRRNLKIPSGTKVIGNIARFELRKGHRWLVDAISILAKKMEKFHVVLVGEGPTKKESEDQVAALGLAEIVTFAGYRSDTCEVTQIFDIFVYPSMLEGLPYSILEAMSQGKPIVATFTDGISEAILDGKTGFLIPPRNSLALAQAVEHLLVDPVLAENMGKAGFTRFEAKYTLNQMIQQNELLYKKLINNDV